MFVSGKAPFPPYNPENAVAMVYGLPISHAEYVRTKKPEQFERSILEKVAERVPLDTLVGA